MCFPSTKQNDTCHVDLLPNGLNRLAILFYSLTRSFDHTANVFSCDQVTG